MRKTFKFIVIFLLIFSFNNRLMAEENNEIKNENLEENTSELIEENNNPVNKNTEGFERNENNNYGVNKKWEITSNRLNYILNTPYVDASLKIYDYSNIFTDEEEKELKILIDDFISKTNMDMVIVSDDIEYRYDSKNEEYAADFYDYNDFGINNTLYDGVILFRNTYENDPYFNVYTFGNAQLYFPYERCENMLDDIYPYYSSHDYMNGSKLFISDFLNYYNSGIPKDYKYYYVDEMGYLQKNFKPPFMLCGLLSAIITAITITIMAKKNKMVKIAKEANDYIDKNSINYKRRENLLINSFTTHHRISSDSSSGGGGGFSSHSGSSGGGHGGGGGRHG